MSCAEKASIGLLDEQVIAGIAAGEVVERPASVVKELVENSLDAGASRVSVELEDREATRIVVSDDGCGIASEEIELALTRHATSKIRTLDDLAVVRSYGFRGEALASIAAVCELRVLSAVAGADAGTLLRMSAGQVVEHRDAAYSKGTRVEVDDLFAAVPARRKFLKSAAHEAALVSDTVRRAALAHPGKHFIFRRNNKRVLDIAPVIDSAARVRQVLGADAASSLLPLDATFSGMNLKGFISAAGESFGSPRRVYCFVNGRWVRDRFLFRALMDGYRTYLLKGRYPLAALFLEADPALFDVNVHPGKLELRFSDAETVRAFIVEAVREALRSAASPLGRWGLEGAAARGAESRYRAPARIRSQDGASRTATRCESPRHGEQPATVGDSAGSYTTVGLEADFAGDRLPQVGGEPATEHAGASAGVGFLPGYTPSPVHGGAEAVGAGYTEAGQERLVFGDHDRPGLLGRYHVVGQVFDGYIICQGEGEIVVVDQHAAHERLLFERLCAAHAEGPIAGQAVLISKPLVVGSAGVEVVEVQRRELLCLGWEIDVFGSEEVLLRAAPAMAAAADVEALAERLIAELCEFGAAVETRDWSEKILATVACHSAVRVGQRMDRRRAEALLKEVAQVEFHASCPHGRPVARSLSRREIERMFGR